MMMMMMMKVKATTIGKHLPISGIPAEIRIPALDDDDDDDDDDIDFRLFGPPEGY
jgi:hypothetical protein